MAETNSLLLPETNMASLKEALCAQQQLLQQLYNELDEEREASATAASEALSMILRLQGEKASLKMEASQYKRMAEEKIYHAEEALAVFEDLIYQRELEIASLEFQVQAYRYKLLSMGCNDLGVYENKFPENLLVQRNETVFGEKGTNSNVRRLNSLPQVLMKDPTKRSSIERRSVTPTLDSTAKNMEECTMQEINGLEKGLGSSSDIEINSYWEQIRRMDEKVKEISDSREYVRSKSAIWKVGTWSPILFSQANGGLFTDPIKALDAADSDQVKNRESSPESEASADPACSTSVQDIFEVPQVAEVLGTRGTPEKHCPRLIMERHKGVEKLDSVSADTIKLRHKDDTRRLKKPLHSAIHELKVPKLRQGMSIEHSVSPVQQEFGSMESKIDYQHLIQRIERLEGARANVRQEIVAEGEEEMNLLKEIHGQLKSIQTEMRKWKAKKPLLSNDSALLDPLQEAMVYFWL